MKRIKTLTQKDFDWVQYTPKQWEKKAEEVIANRKEVFEKIKSIPAKERTFENTVFALEKSGREVSGFMVKIDVLLNMSPRKVVREVCEKLSVLIGAQLINIEFDKDIYNALLEYKKNYKKEKLEGIDIKLFKDYLRDYTKMGFSLSERDQKKLKKINKRISKLSSDFSVNINNYSDYILVSKSETEGLSDIFLHSLKKEKGKYKVSLDYPEMIPFMEMSACEKKRKKLSEKASKKGGRKNLTILSEILQLKDVRARMLGYKNHTDFIIEDRMAKKGKNVEDFYEPLLKKIEKPGRADLKMLEDYKREKTKNKKTKIQSHDIAYYANLLQKEKYGVDEQKVKEYFQLDVVKPEMMKMFGDLFGFEMKKNNRVKLWHSDVEFYDVYSNGKKVSHVAFDLHPREGKFGHAAMWDLQYGYQINLQDYGVQAPMGVVVCNFAKKNKDAPSLMTISDVETFFHEFGHALHHVLSEVKYASYFGVDVSWDFVETPSQLLENWFWSKIVLKKISRHWKTRKSLSNTEIENLIGSKYFLKSYGALRQLILIKLDQDLHTKSIKKPQMHWQKLSKKYFKLDQYEKTLFPAGFGHIVGGYDAGYYSYLWALAYADDIFSEFKKKGIFNKTLGRKYRKEILAVGGSRDEKVSVEKFLGRKTNNKAFLKKLGIK